MNQAHSNLDENQVSQASRDGERGSAILLALMVMALLMVFVAVAISRTTTETVVMANDSSEGRSYQAAQASLEVMTRNFNKIFDEKINPTTADLSNIEARKPDLGTGNYSEFDWEQKIKQTESAKQTIITGDLLQGLYAQRSAWEVETTATEKATGVEVQLKRSFYNNLVPIFQFGIFYNDDLEFHPGPRFDFGGRVHSNANLYLSAQTGLYFSSRVTAKGQVLTQKARNGKPYTEWGDNVHIRNGAGKYVRLLESMGSALHNTTNGTNLCDDPNSFPRDAPPCYRNAAWETTHRSKFDGNLLSDQKRLDLPLGRGQNRTDYIELIKRGKFSQAGYIDLANFNGVVRPVAAGENDNTITSRERYTNKNGIRISLADSKAKLPGCASGVLTEPVAAACGVRLDGHIYGGINRDSANLPYNAALNLRGEINALPPTGKQRGYLPRPMRDGYQATRVNGERFSFASEKQSWVKVEMVAYDPATNNFRFQDITEDFLSLGVTEAAPNVANNFEILKTADGLGNYYTAATDTRSILKLQHFAVRGPEIKSNSGFLSFQNSIGGLNYVQTDVDNDDEVGEPCRGEDKISSAEDSEVIEGTLNPEEWHKVSIKAANNNFGRCAVPFPIKMFDAREGLTNDSMNPAAFYKIGGNAVVPKNGVMTTLNIDVGNMRRFLRGEFDNFFPANTVHAATNGALKSAQVPQSDGYVLYVSDRRGDADFDGEYDMEDIYVTDTGTTTTEPGEDVNRDNVLQKSLGSEAPASMTLGGKTNQYMNTSLIDQAAVYDTDGHYRRSVRLINGTLLPGKYDAADPRNTAGFTVASENGVYVQGNYNASGVNFKGSPTPDTEYIPQNTSTHIPASVVGDAVTILSTNWSDARSFKEAFNLNARPAEETTIRFAMISGDALSSFEGTPNQGGGNQRMVGGVHNFKRFLENWSGKHLNYTGSMINLYNARNNNGAFKCCINTYSPPNRNWAFDASFLDPSRLPPGTPFIQFIQFTGFERIND